LSNGFLKIKYFSLNLKKGRRGECRAREENKSARERYDTSAGRVDGESGKVRESK